MNMSEAIQFIAPVEGDEGALMREVFARYGEAMYGVQVLEHGVVNAILVLKILPTMSSYTDRMTWEAAFDRFYDEELSNTFGTMLKRLIALNHLPANMVERLREAKRARDNLAHSFFRNHDESTLSIDGKVAMLRECQQCSTLFFEVDHELDVAIAEERSRFGITDEWVENHVRAAINRVEARNRD